MKKIKLKERVQLKIYDMPHYADPGLAYCRQHPMRYYNVVAYLNDKRITGPKDYGGITVCAPTVYTEWILRAVGIPEEIISQIDFEKS